MKMYGGLNMERNDAVSPVIGVILMVAITVILAAVIAAFVFGMAGSVSSTKNIAFIAELTGADQTAVMVTNHGGNDLESLVSLAASDGEEEITLTSDDLINVGDSVRLEFNDGNPKRLILTGTFRDGTTSILLDRSY